MKSIIKDYIKGYFPKTKARRFNDLQGTTIPLRARPLRQFSSCIWRKHLPCAFKSSKRLAYFNEPKLFSKTLLFLLPVLALSCAEKTAEKAPPPNVIYICMEDMMPSFGCYGDTIAYTPEIDKFSKEAILFKDVHCQVALCTPSRTSVLTGIRPSTSGIVKIDDDWQKILPNAVSLPRHFKDNGYHTVIAGKIHDYRCGGMDSAYTKEFDIHGIEGNELPFKAIEEVKNQDKPFFLAIGYSQAHDPWKPNPSAESHYSNDQFSAENKHPVYKKQTYDVEGIKNLQKKYYGEITEVDSLVGGVLSKIKALGLDKNSIIIVGAMDHGYSFGNHGHWGKGNNYDDETQVPLLVSLPNHSVKDVEVNGLVELVDIYPTLIDLCGLPNPTQSLEGLSFKQLLFEPKKAWKKAAFVHRAYAKDIVGIKTKAYTFIDFAGDSVELFDRVKDPLNLNNIAEANPEIVQQLQIIKNKGWEKALPE
ncbi:sulfatase-like hydrolase/transferase [Flexithrix dorotheae]|uniref:sulfatase-like hydrolase/transferase n=1 Tax=Flexithrix dorotheae TaxID=70993 RepID=UPI000A0123D1|nr:sulfatase-like hydrolase/transferase [Flexithrix dorotheae]